MRVLKLWNAAWPQFLKGTWVTVYTSAITVFFGLIFGSLICLMRMGKSKILRFIGTVYVEIIRGTPILLQLWIFFLLPAQLGLVIDKYLCALFALVVNSTAYVSELIRSGIQSVDAGQTEAARSLGLTSGQTMLKIVLPQAVRNILPAIGNEFIMIIKETSLLSTFMIGDIMTVRATVGAAYFLPFQALIIAGVIYFVLTYVMSNILNLMERRMRQNA